MRIFSLFIFIFMLFSTTSFAEESANKDSQTPPAIPGAGATFTYPGGNALDYLNSKDSLPSNGVTNNKPKPPKRGIKLTSKCTDKTGRSYSATEAGYEECLKYSELRTNHGQTKNGTTDLGVSLGGE